MTCPHCGYALTPFETECPRCEQAAKSTAPRQQAHTPEGGAGFHQVIQLTHTEVVKQNAGVAEGGAGFGIASMVLGIIGLLTMCLWFLALPCALLAVIFGVVGLQRWRGGRGMAIAGLVTGIIALAPPVIIVVGLLSAAAVGSIAK